jgi:hypothetical protein
MRRLIALATRNDSLGIGDDCAVAEEDIDVVRCGEQRADVHTTVFTPPIGMTL